MPYAPQGGKGLDDDERRGFKEETAQWGLWNHEILVSVTQMIEDTVNR
jgi:hypothetical protein